MDTGPPDPYPIVKEALCKLTREYWDDLALDQWLGLLEEAKQAMLIANLEKSLKHYGHTALGIYLDAKWYEKDCRAKKH